jgi:hypothetical protein
VDELLAIQSFPSIRENKVKVTAKAAAVNQIRRICLFFAAKISP